VSTRGWENATLNDVRDRRQPVKRSKYRNVTVEINGERFDSKREAAYWQGLKARERNGEIRHLRRQVPFTLCAPQREDGKSNGCVVTVAIYVADFVFEESAPDWAGWRRKVVDAKGKRTALYALKKKWLELQDGIVIEEV
jgi:hypothetical protein